MPFTLAHPAAVIPIARITKNRLVFSALAIGSMAPDFDYILRGKATGESGHSLLGLFAFCLPLGFLVFVLFQRGLKKPLLSLLPEGLRSRLYQFALPYSLSGVPAVLLVVASILLGAATHLLWDAFTHQSGWAVRHAGVLATSLLSLPGYELSLFKLLQHGSTILGLGALVFAAARAVDRLPQRSNQPSFPVLPQHHRRVLILMLGLVPLLAGLVGGVSAFLGVGGIRGWAAFVVQGAITSMAGLVAALVGVASAYWLYVVWVKNRGQEA